MSPVKKRKGGKMKWIDRVEALIKRFGSPEALAAKLGVSYYTVIRWKGGSHEPSKVMARMLEQLEQLEQKKVEAKKR